MKNPLRRFSSWFKDNKKPVATSPSNRRLTPEMIAEQQRQLAEQKTQAAARQQALNSASKTGPRNRPKHVAIEEELGQKRKNRISLFKKGPAHKAQARKERREKNAIGPVIRDVLSGEFLTREGVTRHIPYLIFVSGLFIAYIAMGYQFERIERDKNKTKRQLEELGAEYKTLQAEFETQLQQSKVEESISALGLKQPVEPPYLLDQKPLKP